MEDIQNAIKYLQGYALALENGVEKFVDALPVIIRQNIDRRANGKLHSTYEQYMKNVNIKNQDYLIVVELDREDWLSNAVETGVDPYSLKEGLLASPKAKTGKQGYTYIRVPLGKKKDAHAGTPKGQQYQAEVDKVLQKPSFGFSSYKISPNGSVNENQKVLSQNPTLQGFYRTRVFENTSALQSPQKPKWSYVLFRTVSNNPMSISQWEHPGIKAANIFKETERWINSNIDRLLDDMIQSEMDILNSKMGK